MRKIKIHHVILLIGGTILLLRGIRFIVEFILLAISVLINCNPFEIFNRVENKNTKFNIYCLGVISASFIMVIFILNNAMSELKRAPLALPRGVTMFLSGLDVGGSLINTPNYGGYTQWMLYPKYKIFMDMEVPHLFTDADMYAALNVFTEGITLKNIIEKYRPDFISVPIGNRNFSELTTKYPDFTAIFFDDIEVLYINKHIYPQIDEKYKLQAINPFTLGGELMVQDKFENSDNYTVG
ncbi:MAG: hypothetical protein HQL01_09985 [Nitrospirae bacterium]|nr:hypothetical protein [Nitrospirota bacterium]